MQLCGFKWSAMADSGTRTSSVLALVSSTLRAPHHDSNKLSLPKAAQAAAAAQLCHC